jgi:NAD(P)-dependent dehydrogenase (short-subunit alcohol dehydrogenase family)
MRLKEKVAIITGGGQGIGREYVLGFMEEGAWVVVADIDGEKAEAVSEEAKAKGGEALALRVDVSDQSSTLKAAEKTVERFGRIDILVNNAALYGALGVKPWDGWSPEEWERSFSVNVIGNWLMIKAVAPYMMEQKKGKIINIGSSTFDIGFPAMMPYTCSKGAVVSLTRTMARALGRYNINVNCLSPGYTLSEASIEMPGSRKDKMDMAFQGRSFRRHMNPEDLVGTALYLASSDSDFLTGQNIRVEGGEIMT